MVDLSPEDNLHEDDPREIERDRVMTDGFGVIGGVRFDFRHPDISMIND